MNVYLIGYRGTGKSTVARLLAARLGWTAVDADEWLEARAGRSIRQIFATDGEPVFRDLESATIRELVQLDRHVVALGGGAVLREENRHALRSNEPSNSDRASGSDKTSNSSKASRSDKTVWLTAPAEALWRRISGDATTGERRPNLTTTGGVEEIRQLLAQREPLYRASADWTVDTHTRSPEEVAEAIHTWLESETGPCN